jgi:hypothetical protein
MHETHVFKRAEAPNSETGNRTGYENFMSLITVVWGSSTRKKNLGDISAVKRSVMGGALTTKITAMFAPGHPE